MFKNKILLITGGTYSYRNAQINRFLDTDIKEIRSFQVMKRSRTICDNFIEVAILTNHPGKC